MILTMESGKKLLMKEEKQKEWMMDLKCNLSCLELKISSRRKKRRKLQRKKAMQLRTILMKEQDPASWSFSEKIS